MLNSELDVLNFWDEHKTFQKSVENRKGKKPFVFLDGPPFATGTPHWGHIFISQVKDTVLRYQTQKDRYVPRRWGWDCHGVPIEALIEKDLNIKDKRQIEDEVGIEAFNDGCRSKIGMFDSQWRETIKRIGRWVDMDDQYRTMDNDFMESVWWGLGQLWDKDLLYKDYRVSLYSPSMGVPLSHTDVAMEVKYQNETINSPIVRFRAEEDSTKALMEKIAEQVILNSKEQIEYQEDLEGRIQGLEKKTTKSKGFKGLTKKATFNKFNLDNLQSEVSEEKELEYLQDQAKIVNQNVDILENLKQVLSTNYPLNLLAWTTTPWTLPANVALTVGNDIDYSLYFLPQTEELVFIAENRVKEVISLHIKEAVIESPEVVSKLESFEDSGEYFRELGLDIIKIVTLKGSDLVGLSYHPLFKLSQKIESYEQKANVFKIYPADFVSEDEGTGIIHIAAYGQDDFDLIKQYNLPVLLSLSEHGEVLDTLDSVLEPVFGKRLDPANKLIIDILERDQQLFASVKYKHKVPYFDRDGKKIYYAPQESWFIGETKMKKKSLELNENVNWHPANIKHGRFGKGLETAPDWSISRNRYWGNPMPIWQTQDQGKTLFIDSVDKLIKYSINPIYRLINSTDINPEKFKNTRSVIFSDIESKIPLGLNTAQYRSKALSELRKLEGSYDMKKFSYVAQKMLEEILELFNKYTTVQMMLDAEEERLWTTWLNGLHPNSKKVTKEFYFYQKVEEEDGEYTAVEAPRLLDLHRPYIDDIILKDEVGNIYTRIEEVLDCWVESGSMPWASMHYPFENKRFVEENSPADWIIEAQDQTRGWFRVLHVLANGVFNRNAYKEVNTSGLIMAKDGRKMSKSKKNYTDPNDLLEKVGSDAIRLYLMSSSLLNAESVKFSDRDLAVVFRNSTITLSNITRFFKFRLESKPVTTPVRKYKHPLNRWLIALTKQYAQFMDQNMEKFELTEAARAVIPYVTDLSTWYVRRIKDLPEEYDQETSAAIVEAGKLFAKYTAYIQPFNTEKLWSVLKSKEDEESVHLTTLDDNLKVSKDDLKLLDEMKKIQEIVSGIHGARKEGNFRVRQPLYADFSKARIKPEYLEIIKSECNLLEKDMAKTEGSVFEPETDFGPIRVDLVLDENLKVLGFARDFERSVQAFRKKLGMKAGQIVSMNWQISNPLDEKIVQEVIKVLDWKKLNVDVTWVKDLDETLDKKFEIKNLTTILVDD